MNNQIKQDALRYIFVVRVRKGEAVKRTKVTGDGEAKLEGAPEEQSRGSVTLKKSDKVGRNDPCPCGSGKKYKNCCGKNE